MSEWPSIYVSIIVCSRPLCIGREREKRENPFPLLLPRHPPPLPKDLRDPKNLPLPITPPLPPPPPPLLHRRVTSPPRSIRSRSRSIETLNRTRPQAKMLKNRAKSTRKTGKPTSSHHLLPRRRRNRTNPHITLISFLPLPPCTLMEK